MKYIYLCINNTLHKNTTKGSVILQPLRPHLFRRKKKTANMLYMNIIKTHSSKNKY